MSLTAKTVPFTVLSCLTPFSLARSSVTTRNDIISYVNGTSQDNDNSPVVEAQVEVEDEPFEFQPEELDKLLEEIKVPKRKRRKSPRFAAEETAAN